MPRPFTFAMCTDPGRVRHGNEDTCAACPEVCAFVVCDGMGGAAAGEIASQLAAGTFLAHIEATHQVRLPGTTPTSRLLRAATAANQAVFQRARPNPRLHGMGTTLIGILLQDAPAPIIPTPAPANAPTPHPTPHPDPEAPPTVWLANVGDSRCYRMRAKTLLQLSSDHSLVEEQFRAGHLTREEADTSPIRNVITRAIGSRPTVEPEVEPYDTEHDDLYLLASDGLSRELGDQQIADILREVPASADESTLATTCHRLIQAANARGGGDNITTLLLQIL